MVTLGPLVAVSVTVTLLNSAGCSLQTVYAVSTATSTTDVPCTKPAWQFLVIFNPALSAVNEQVAVCVAGVIVLPPGPVAAAVTLSVQLLPTLDPVPEVGLVIVE
jgi:hypothetical protein